MRLFVAIETSLAQKEAVTTVYCPGRHDGVLWVAPDSIHITIKFLGEVEATRVGDVAAGLTAAARLTPPFPLGLGGGGCFPNKKTPRVIWVGVQEGREEVETLAAAVDRFLSERGFAPETKKFHAHVTLGRVKDENAAAKVVAAKIARLGSFAVPPENVDALTLMRSTLRPAGAVYEQVDAFPLGG